MKEYGIAIVASYIFVFALGRLSVYLWDLP